MRSIFAAFPAAEEDSNVTINEKLALLRGKMRENGIDAFYVPTADPHMSEYIAPCYQSRAWISGFNGSAGQALIFADDARLWTDGRYFIQAEKQLEGSEFHLMKQGTPGYPKLYEYIVKHLPKGGTLGVNGELLSRSEVEKLEKLAADEGFSLALDKPLVEAVWTDRPAPPEAPIFLLDDCYSGRPTEDKLTDLRKHLEDKGYDAALFGRLDDIAWLFNYRGGDIAHTPVALAYAYVSAEDAVLFIDEAKVSEPVRETLKLQGIRVEAYDKAADFVAALPEQTICLDKAGINNRLYSAIPAHCRVRQERNWTETQKAIKNAVEIANQREAYRKDGLAVTRMIHWLKTAANLSEIDELQVSETLLGYREALNHFIEQSFTTIAAYGPNAAMMHYAPTPENKAGLEPKGFLLVDSGGQYLEGTTDTTRTIALGPLSEAEIKAYTLTLKSHIALASAVFLEGTTGYYLDALARQPLWKHFIDYKCGTGHGVGYLLNVHEGPHRISPHPNDVALVPGMVVTDEPGVYLEGRFGIRIENVYAVEEACYVEPDRFYQFSNLTQVPMEREAIDVNLLTKDEIEWVDHYHAEVYRKLHADLTREEAAWLKEVCRPLLEG